MIHEILNLDQSFAEDMQSGLGFIIDTPIPVTKKELIRNPRGIYSSLYGGDITDITEIQKRYKCECGETIGKFRAGTICPHCHTEVKFQDDELERCGWMVLKEPYFVINPKMYQFLESILKAKRLDEMIKFDRKLDKHGKLITDLPEKQKNPYANIGLVEFRNRFVEIIQTMGDKKKSMEIEFVMNNLDKVFTSHIPVISLLLRPVVLIGNTTFNYDPLNKFYAEMVSHIAYINENMDDEFTYANLSILYELQKKFNELNDEITKQKINGKKHAIRSFIMGSRINFSARHVLIPNTESVQLDSIVIPYLTFVEFYKFHIMNIFKKKSYLDLRYVYEALSNEGGENPLDYDAFIASNKKFIAVGYDADHAQPHYFTKEDMGRNQYQVLEASCCLPVVCQSVEIDGIHYYDGGLADPVPVQKALDDGCDEVVLILTRPLEKRENNKQDIMTAKILSKFDELAAKNLLKRADRYNQGVEIVKELEKQGKGLIVAPDTIGDMSTLTKDKEKLYLLYIKGYTDGEKIKKFLERNS